MGAVCEFCGRELPLVSVYGLTFPKPCICFEATCHRAKLDEEDRRRDFEETLAEAVGKVGLPRTCNVYDAWGDGSSVYIYGKQGLGKTEMACGAVRKWLRDGMRTYESNGKRHYESRSARFVTVPELLTRLKDSYDSWSTSEESIMGAMGGVGMLVLDDMGKGKMTEWVAEKLYTVIDMRYRNRDRCRTVITSNYSLDEMTAGIAAATDGNTAAAIRSRIEGMCASKRVCGRDWRVTER